MEDEKNAVLVVKVNNGYVLKKGEYEICGIDIGEVEGVISKDTYIFESLNGVFDYLTVNLNIEVKDKGDE